MVKKSTEIYYGELEYDNGLGLESRPVVLIKPTANESWLAFKISSSYHNKNQNVSRHKKKYYYEIKDWRQRSVGLSKRSWIDTSKFYEIENISSFLRKGKLTDNDFENLVMFIRKNK
jgi:hypothetical protein